MLQEAARIVNETPNFFIFASIPARSPVPASVAKFSLTQ